MDWANVLVSGVARVLLTLGLPAQVEERELGPHGLRRPDVYTTVNGTDYALDVTTAMVDQVDGL